jgi:hypothetical protein
MYMALYNLAMTGSYSIDIWSDHINAGMGLMEISFYFVIMAN